MSIQDPQKAGGDEHRAYFFASYDSAGNRISFTGVPLERECINCGRAERGSDPDYYHWNVEFPDRNFAYELLDYAGKIDEDFREVKSTEGS